MSYLQNLGLKLIKENLSKDSYLHFEDNWLKTYFDNSGQRGHYLIQSKMYGVEFENQYFVKRVLSFTNQKDEGKDKAMLFEINLNKCKVVGIKEESVKFDNFEIFFNNNPWTQKLDFIYD